MSTQVAKRDSGFTLLEVLLALTITSILVGIVSMFVRDGVVNARRYQDWFNAQTHLTRVITEISYGYGQFPGAAGAISIDTPSTTQLCLVYNDTSDKIVYYLDGDMLKRYRQNAEGVMYIGSDEIMLTQVDYIRFTVSGNSLVFEIGVNPMFPNKKTFRAIQQVYLRNM